MQTYQFAVTAIAPSGRRVVISRHMTLNAAQKAAAKGTADFAVEALS